jgi:hypothetical protein
MQGVVKMWVLGLLSFAYVCSLSLGQAIPKELPPSERWRVEVALRSKGDFPTATTFTFTVSANPRLVIPNT